MEDLMFESRRPKKSRTEGFMLRDKKTNVCKAAPLTREIMLSLPPIPENDSYDP
jgi:hypothetical protein